MNNRVYVLLLAPHTHAGVQYIKGDVITVTIADSEWLINRGVAMLQPVTKQKVEDK